MIGAMLAKRNIPKAFDALNRKDMDAYLKDWAQDAALVYPGDLPGISGTHKGIDAVREFYAREFQQFTRLRLTPKHIAVTNIFDMTGDNVVAIEWDAEITNIDGIHFKYSGVAMMTVRRRKVIRVVLYVFLTGEQLKNLWGLTESME